jgi:uncharacterized coiled-coil DUF342 family protein
MSDLANKGQDIHAQMVTKIENVKNIRSQADTQHQTYIQSKEQTKQLLVEIAVVRGQINGLRSLIKEQSKVLREKEDADRLKENEQLKQEENQKIADAQQLKEKLGAQAKDKLERGEKVSWDEFQLLADQDEADSNVEV